MIGWCNNNVGFLTAIVGLITIVAIAFSPLIALKVQKRLENNQEINSRKMRIFRTLMATRAPADRTSFEHVQALNMIDIEFYNDDEVISAWNIYRDHLNSPGQNETQHQLWWQNFETYFIDLLFVIAKLLNYNLDKVLLKKGVYFPEAHGTINMQNNQIRVNLIKLLNGEQVLKVETTCLKCEKKIANTEAITS